MEFNLAATGRMTLWEMWWTPEWKPCCDQVQSMVSIIPSLRPHWYEDFHHRIDVEWLSLIVFRCLERAKSQSHEKPNKKKLNSPNAPEFSSQYYFAYQIFQPRGQYLHKRSLIYGNGGAEGRCNTTNTIYLPTVGQMYFFVMQTNYR